MREALQSALSALAESKPRLMPSRYKAFNYRLCAPDGDYITCHGDAGHLPVHSSLKKADSHQQLHRQQTQHKAKSTVNKALKQFIGPLLFCHQLLEVTACQQAR